MLLLLGDCPWLPGRLSCLCLLPESPHTQDNAQLTTKVSVSQSTGTQWMTFNAMKPFGL